MYVHTKYSSIYTKKENALKACCGPNQKSYMKQIIWFFITAIGNPINFLLILPFPKDMFFYEIPNRNMLMLHIFPFIMFCLSVKIVWYLLLVMIAYVRGNNVARFLTVHILPQSKMALAWQLMVLAVGYTNLYLYTLRGMDATIVGLAFFMLITVIALISLISCSITLYKILRKRFV